eukprot:gene9444-10431_t
MAKVANDSMNEYVTGMLKMANIAYCGRCKYASGYEFSPNIKCSHCTTPAEDSKLLNFESMLETPVFLLLTLQQVSHRTNVPMSTRAQIPPKLDLRCSIAGDEDA